MTPSLWVASLNRGKAGAPLGAERFWGLVRPYMYEGERRSGAGNWVRQHLGRNDVDKG